MKKRGGGGEEEEQEGKKREGKKIEIRLPLGAWLHFLNNNFP